MVSDQPAPDRVFKIFASIVLVLQTLAIVWVSDLAGRANQRSILQGELWNNHHER